MHLLYPWRCLEFHQGQTCLPCQACRRAAGVKAPRTSFSPRRRLAQAARGLAAPRAFCQLPPAMFPSLPGLPARGAAHARQARGSFRFRASRWQGALPASLLTPKGAGTQPPDRGQAHGRPGTDNSARLRRRDAGNGRTAGSLSLRPGPEAGSMPSAWTMPSRRTRRAFHAPLLLCAAPAPCLCGSGACNGPEVRRFQLKRLPARVPCLRPGASASGPHARSPPPGCACRACLDANALSANPLFLTRFTEDPSPARRSVRAARPSIDAPACPASRQAAGESAGARGAGSPMPPARAPRPRAAAVHA